LKIQAYLLRIFFLAGIYLIKLTRPEGYGWKRAAHLELSVIDNKERCILVFCKKVMAMPSNGVSVPLSNRPYSYFAFLPLFDK
jgi:hypothetical protein